MSVSRKLFRLFKSFNEYVKIKGILKLDKPQLDKNLAVIARLGFLFYWLFDNLSVLIKIKFLNGFDQKQMARRASKCWLFGIWVSIICALLELYKVSTKESQLLLSRANAKVEAKGDSQEDFQAALKAVRAQKKTQVLNIIKNLGDSITASQSLGYPNRFFGLNFSDGLVGVGGFTSAAITCYQLYPKKK